MALHAARAGRLSPRRGWPRTVLFVTGAICASLVIAAWLTDTSLPTASAALPANPDRLNFEDRFAFALRHPALAKADLALTTTREALALRWMPEDFRAREDFRGAIADDERRSVERRQAATTEIPLPRSRPAAADQVAQVGPALALAENPIPVRPTDRPFLQRLSDLMPSRLKLASLTPNGGLLGRGPDLGAFGYDASTAVYDISARAVYLPNGTVLEAHSGMGGLRDDPDHVSVRMQGATPPAIYALKPREKEFHGVAALRMTPVDGSDIAGRSGLLVHSFMLGPNGDSNGCISVRDYDRFLKAFNDGQFNRIAVVPSLKAVAETLLAAQNNNPT